MINGDKPYITFIHLDLVADPDTPIIRHQFGIQSGVNGLIKELNDIKAVGVDHVGLQFRRNSRPIEESMKDIADNIFPVFHQ